MKKTIFILTVLMFSCTQQKTVTIDGCEYIETTSFGGESFSTSLAHKGNCKNQIHYYVTDTTQHKNAYPNYSKSEYDIPIKDTLKK
jgi:hypothetical protein